MKKWIMKMERKTRVVLHLLLLTLSVATYAIYAVAKSLYFVAATALLLALAWVIFFLSPDRKEWYDPGNMFMRFSAWSRKHPITLALLVTAHVAIILTIGFLFIIKDTKKFIINMIFCAVLFLCLSVFGLVFARRIEKGGKEERR